MSVLAVLGLVACTRDFDAVLTQGSSSAQPNPAENDDDGSANPAPSTKTCSSDCTVSCPANESCDLTCEDSAFCGLECMDGASCALIGPGKMTCEDGANVTCNDGSVVCRRSCPK